MENYEEGRTKLTNTQLYKLKSRQIKQIKISLSLHID